MPKINSLSEIDYASSPLIEFDATVINIIAEGEDKRPCKFTVKLESSGENVIVLTWKKADFFDDIKRLVNENFVCSFKGRASVYKDTDNQICIDSMTITDKISQKKVLRAVEVSKYKEEIQMLINTYVSNSFYKKLLQDLIMNNEKFWNWPAAHKVHHNFPGGLAKHSLNVCKNAIATWKTYQGSNLSIELIVVGSLLHDIGKLDEYKQGGDRTIYGDLIPHPVSGVLKVSKAALAEGLNPDSDSKVIMLNHIILSHHEKLEFGSPVQPTILEALIIARADALDATFETVDATLDTLDIGTETNRLIAADNAKFLKWH